MYPNLTVDLKKIEKNAQIVCDFCRKWNIDVAGVIKFSNGDIKVSESYYKGGCKQLASSRTRQLKKIKETMADVETMLIRIPMISEAMEVVRWCDFSLNSEEKVLWALNDAAEECNSIHKVVLMYDVGDRREGIVERSKVVQLAQKVEREMNNLYLAGVGSSFACMSGVLPDENNLEELAICAKEIEIEIGRKLDIVSGGSSITLKVLYEDGNIPKEINHLRIGGAIANPMGLRINRGVEIEGMSEEAFLLTAEVVEVGEKGSAVGSSGKNWAGQSVEIVDNGLRRRAIVALGSQDIGDAKQLVPVDKNITVIGGSSDHTVLDIGDVDHIVEPGDKIEFRVFYMPLLYCFATDNVELIYRE